MFDITNLEICSIQYYNINFNNISYIKEGFLNVVNYQETSYVQTILLNFVHSKSHILVKEIIVILGCCKAYPVPTSPTPAIHKRIFSDTPLYNGD